MRSVPLPFLSKITLLWTRAREPGPVSPVKVDSPIPFPWTQRGEIYTNSGSSDQHCLFRNIRWLDGECNPVHTAKTHPTHRKYLSRPYL